MGGSSGDMLRGPLGPFLDYDTVVILKVHAFIFSVAEMYFETGAVRTAPEALGVWEYIV